MYHLLNPTKQILFVRSLINKTKNKYIQEMLRYGLLFPLRYFYNIEIGGSFPIGEGFECPHRNVIIGAKKIGKNVKIYQFSTLGAKNPQKNKLELPTIEDNVVIYANCIIVGNVTIKKGTIVPAGSIIVGK